MGTPQKHRILIVDDNEDIHADFRKILLPGKNTRSREKLRKLELRLFDEDPPEEKSVEEKNPSIEVEYQIDSAFQGLDALEMVQKADAEDLPYSLIFMDVRMPPGIDGIETISRLWRTSPNVEVVICTAYSDYSFEEILTNLGSTDRLLFLNKPFDSIVVKQMALSLTRKWTLHDEARRHVLRLEDEINQRKQSERRLHELIHHDPLTSLANRAQLQIDLQDAITSAQKQQTRCAIFFIDLDRFKEINDTLGYQNGDQLLNQIGQRLCSAIGANGKVYRQGGDEFAILAPKIKSPKFVENLAHEVLHAFEPPFEIGNINIVVQLSMGIVIYPNHGCSVDMLMRHGDATILGAKRSGQGYKFYPDTLNLHNPQRLLLLSELRKALQENQLMLFFKPKVNLRTKQIVAVEAVCRWPHPSHGFVPPQLFIPLAERCGAIKPLTSWVLQKVPEQWAAWRAKGIDLMITVNLASQDLSEPTLPFKIKDYLSRCDMPPNRLLLEISESSVMVDSEQARSMLSILSGMGIASCIDKFGTGHSSLAYLKMLPVNEVKIDGSFVSNLGNNPNEAAIVKSMIKLGHNLGLMVSCEDVTTQEALQFLSKSGCDFLQGLAVCAAMPGGEFPLWLEDSDWEVASDHTLIQLHQV